MQTDGMSIGHTAVNIDETELNCNYMPIEALRENVPENIQIITMENDILSVIKEARIGFEFWHYILYLTIFLVMIEMLISNVPREN